MMAPQTLGEILSAILTGPDDDEWLAFDAAADLIACHYRLNREDVWVEIAELEAETFEQEGLACLGNALHRPWGFAALGQRVAQRLMDVDDAAAHPALHLTVH